MMRCVFPAKLIGRSRRSCKIILVALWCAGLICGIWIAAGAGNITSLMRACCQSRVSIVGLFFVPLLPFLFSAAAVYLSYPWLLYPIGFFKAFSFGFCACVVTLTYGSAGWLMRYLLLFTDCMTIPVLCWFWMRHADGNTAHLGKDGLICMVLFLLTAVFDHAFISPLLIRII